MIWAGAWLVLAAVFLMFGAVVLSGAPYVPTLTAPTQGAIKLLGLKKGQTFYDLGSGDGRLLAAAANQGLRAIGYELNPILVLISRRRLKRYANVQVRWGSFWRADISDADGVFVFLVDIHMKRLDRYLKKQKRPLRLVSYAFEIPGKKPLKRQGALVLYRYP